jgi:putative SOS response-associated peptidase YedK
VPDLPPRYNAAQTDRLPVVRLDREGNRELAVLRWGPIPLWAKDENVGFKSINARAETAASSSLTTSVCGDGSPFAMAGLWERWKKGAEPIESFTIMVQPFPAD